MGIPADCDCIFRKAGASGDGRDTPWDTPCHDGGSANTGLNSSARNTPIACDQSTPEVADPAGAIN
jgi:hypothetical protein